MRTESLVTHRFALLTLLLSLVNASRPSFLPPPLLIHTARSDAEAQRLYYHIRTLCFWLDAASEMLRIPFLDSLPFSFGVEALIGGLLPVAGQWRVREERGAVTNRDALTGSAMVSLYDTTPPTYSPYLHYVHTNTHTL